MKNLHGWVITYNQFTDRWLAAQREHYSELFNGGDNVLKFTTLESLITILSRTGGDKKKIQSLLK